MEIKTLLSQKHWREGRPFSRACSLQGELRSSQPSGQFSVALTWEGRQRPPSMNRCCLKWNPFSQAQAGRDMRGLIPTAAPHPQPVPRHHMAPLALMPPGEHLSLLDTALLISANNHRNFLGRMPAESSSAWGRGIRVCRYMHYLRSIYG